MSSAEKLIPKVITECSICVNETHKKTCIPEEVRPIVGDIDSAKRATGCDSEKCVVNTMRSKIDGRYGKGTTERILETRYKIDGPTDTSLLNNTNIDNTLIQWSEHYPEFFPYNFNMSDYKVNSYVKGRVVNHPDTLETVKFAKLIDDGYKCAGCVINTDVYNGHGKHWMALFADVRGKEAIVEFFNSSGRAPTSEWIDWLYSTRDDLETKGYKVRVVKGYGVQHQRSKSECGVYALFYIWCRIRGVHCDEFKKPIADERMFEFRQHLFNNPQGVIGDKFSFVEFKKHNTIKWEKD